LTALGFPNNTGTICDVSSNANGSQDGSTPCVNNCSAPATQHEGCGVEMWAYNSWSLIGASRFRCTNATTTSDTPAMQEYFTGGAINDAIACACNN